CVFFFSSRRRHTRLVSDWSSDVCSSDLGPEVIDLRRGQARSAALTAPKLAAADTEDERTMVGSNSWAVAGAQARDGRAMLANDKIGRASCRERVGIAGVDGSVKKDRREQ